MFRSRRTSTYKLLWRAAAKRRASNATPTPGVAGAATTGIRPTSQQQAWLDDPVTKNQLHAFLKKLSETDLESLQRCVLSNGADLAPCIFLDPAPFLAARAEDTPPAPTPLAPHLLACRTWRWPDLDAEAQIRHLHSLCPGQDASGRVCCNPHHWSRRCLPESPPPAYSRLPLPLAANCCYPPSMLGVENVSRSTTPPPPPESQETHGSLPLGSTGPDGVRVRPWATLAYWEGRKRVGRLLPVNTPAVAVFASKGAGPPQPGSQALGLCLATLTQATPPESEHVRRTREKIGLGALLEKVGGEVWLYNRSDSPIFVHSPTLDPPPATPTARTLVVYKVPPGYALRIHDEDRALLNQQLARRGRTWEFASEESTTATTSGKGGGIPSYFPAVSPPPAGTGTAQGYGACSAQEWTEFSDGPYDPNAVRISFAKGWGPKYSRQFITSCPCWLEVLLAMPCR